MKNTLTDLRNHLFETIEALKDEENPMPVDRARAISDAAGKIIESGKVELQCLDLLGDRQASKFFDTPRAIAPRNNARHAVPSPPFPPTPRMAELSARNHDQIRQNFHQTAKGCRMDSLAPHLQGGT